MNHPSFSHHLQIFKQLWKIYDNLVEASRESSVLSQYLWKFQLLIWVACLSIFFVLSVLLMLITDQKQGLSSDKTKLNCKVIITYSENIEHWTNIYIYIDFKKNQLVAIYITSCFIEGNCCQLLVPPLIRYA